MPAQSKQTAVVICPGRGTYNKEELGYFHRYHSDKPHILDTIDAYRATLQQIPVRELDNMNNYSMQKHTVGENASALIYACCKGDMKSISDKYEIVAVTGNSMGWYLALAVAGALNPKNAIALINTMGSMMTDGIIGGQAIYPIVNDNWQVDPERVQQVNSAIHQINQQQGCELYHSIYLGGYGVLGGNQAALKALEQTLPNIDNRYPMRLYNHAAFHTPLLQQTSDKAFELLSHELFASPKIPLVDGEGSIWQPHSTNTLALRDYTLGTQVVEPYDFSKAVEIAIKEFAPDKLIITGPGTTLGGAVAQCLIQHNWLGLACKSDFIQMQKVNPFVLSMGMEDQRNEVIG